MPGSRSLLFPALVLFLAACSRGPAPAPTAKKVAAEPAPSAVSKPAAPTEAPAPALPDLGDFRVVDVVLGNAIGPDQQVLSAQTRFAPGDTIYASVLTTGTHTGLNLSAKWSQADGTPVALSQQALVADAPLAVAFHVTDPAGWPSGHYQVEIAADGQVLQTREFDVR